MICKSEDMERMGLLELRPGPQKEGSSLPVLATRAPTAWGPASEKPGGGGVSEDDTRKWDLSVWKVQTGVSFCDRKDLPLLG